MRRLVTAASLQVQVCFSQFLVSRFLLSLEHVKKHKINRLVGDALDEGLADPLKLAPLCQERRVTGLEVRQTFYDEPPARPSLAVALDVSSENLAGLLLGLLKSVLASQLPSFAEPVL